MEITEVLREDLLSFYYKDEEVAINNEIGNNLESIPQVREQYFFLYRDQVSSVFSVSNFEESSIKAAVFGLWKASLKYDHKRGYRFMSYAIHWIEASIERKESISSCKINDVYIKKQ